MCKSNHLDDENDSGDDYNSKYDFGGDFDFNKSKKAFKFFFTDFSDIWKHESCKKIIASYMW